MDYLQTIVLALTQGLTEFLPISSSAHLILIGKLPGWSDQGLFFDVAVHFGTLGAVCWYFNKDLRQICTELLKFPVNRQMSPEILLVGKIGAATLPIFLVGFILYSVLDVTIRSIEVIAYSTIVFALLLWFADRFRAKDRPVVRSSQNGFTLSWWHALFIGSAQVFALIPGASRAGVTITAALLLGISRVEAATFSFLLAIPAITGSLILLLIQSVPSEIELEWEKILLGTIVAGITAFATIRLFIQLIERIGMIPFVIYRLGLGAILLLLI